MKACKHGCQFTSQVLEYRYHISDLLRQGYSMDELKKELDKTGKDRLKTSLPLATVGAVCSGGRKMENVKKRTGWIALDIDAKDNPHLPNAEQVRDEVARIKNVAFSALSASGQGVWALVKVSDPDRQAKHFRALEADFKSFGITLDSTKGKNPNDARFYSYDPDAVMNTSYIEYRKIIADQSRLKPSTSVNGCKSKYAESALCSELETLSTTQLGNRNNQLFKSTAALAELVASGLLDRHEVSSLLYEAALAIGLKPSEVNKTLKSGFQKGLCNPRYP
jgi:hypothetical protein